MVLMTHDPLGGLAQLARALALQARGHRFDSDILHKKSSFKHDNDHLGSDGSHPDYQPGYLMKV